MKRYVKTTIICALFVCGFGLLASETENFNVALWKTIAGIAMLALAGVLHKYWNDKDELV